MTPNEKQAAIVQVRRERGLGLKDGYDFVSKHGDLWREAAEMQFGTVLFNETLEKEQLTRIRAAVQEYYAALDRREHGGVAQDRAFAQIQSVLDMHWTQGATLRGE